jgi:hypothetical protein
LAAVLGLFIAMPAAPAFAGSASEPEQTVPQGEDPPGSEAAPPESQTPSEHKGVIVPPPTGDKDIETDVPNPNAGHDEEVIPPPDGQVEPR